MIAEQVKIAKNIAQKIVKQNQEFARFSINVNNTSLEKAEQRWLRKNSNHLHSGNAHLS